MNDELMDVTDEQMKWRRAAAAIDRADGILIGAGWGMSADSGLPDPWDADAVEREFPFLRQSGIRLEELASEQGFLHRPRLAWGFFMHLLHLTRHMPPHTGYGILKHWVDSRGGEARVITHNVDGHFALAGFAPEQLVECNGSLHRLQSLRIGPNGPISADTLLQQIDGTNGELVGELPVDVAGGPTRPNVKLPDGSGWDERVLEGQLENLECWKQRMAGKDVVLLEMGTCRDTDGELRQRCGLLARELGAARVRIDLAACDGEAGVIALRERPVTALARLHFLIASGEVG
jgi:hypothetical protein